jgi:Leucine-rich repeat (LRR) protein
VIRLNIEGLDLNGELKLKGFTNLKELYCLRNSLTDLDLSDCKNLLHLDSSGNQFTSTEFLNTIPNKDKLKVLVM